MTSENAGDGSDALGRGMTVTIRIEPDGTLYVNDITVDLLPVLQAVCPRDRVLGERAAAARSLRRGSAE